MKLDELSFCLLFLIFGFWLVCHMLWPSVIAGLVICTFIYWFGELI